MAMIPYGIITQGLYGGLISGIGTMTFGMCKIIKSIYSHKNPDVDNFIKKLDIEYRVNLISTILKKYNKTKTIDIKEHICDKSVIFTVLDNRSLSESMKYRAATDPLQISLMYLSTVICDIHNDLILIDKQIAYHQSKWFNSWRVMNIKKYLDSLETNNSLLLNRFDDFMKISALARSIE